MHKAVFNTKSIYNLWLKTTYHKYYTREEIINYIENNHITDINNRQILPKNDINLEELTNDIDDLDLLNKKIAEEEKIVEEKIPKGGKIPIKRALKKSDNSTSKKPLKKITKTLIKKCFNLIYTINASYFDDLLPENLFTEDEYVNTLSRKKKQTYMKNVIYKYLLEEYSYFLVKLTEDFEVNKDIKVIMNNNKLNKYEDEADNNNNNNNTNNNNNNSNNNSNSNMDHSTNQNQPTSQNTNQPTNHHSANNDDEMFVLENLKLTQQLNNLQNFMDNIYTKNVNVDITRETTDNNFNESEFDLFEETAKLDFETLNGLSEYAIKISQPQNLKIFSYYFYRLYSLLRPSGKSYDDIIDMIIFIIGKGRDIYACLLFETSENIYEYYKKHRGEPYPSAIKYADKLKKVIDNIKSFISESSS